MKRREIKIDKVRSSFKSVERDLYTIDEKIDYIKDLLILRPYVSFHQIFREKAAKMEIVYYLSKKENIFFDKTVKEVTVSQQGTFSEIWIRKIERDIK